MWDSILWRRLDQPGHDAARLIHRADTWLLSGAAAFEHERLPCRLDYVVACNEAWETTSAKIAGWIGGEAFEIEVAVDAERRWWLNGTERPAVAGCIDFDINFSPSTNLLPIRRLSLDPGQSAEVSVAWLRFPSYELDPLPQLYRRIDAYRYHYDSDSGSFIAELSVNEAGFVTEYPPLWTLEAVTPARVR